MANGVAAASGSNAYTQALGIAIQLVIFYTLNASITNEQSAALAVLLFPWVHYFMMKLGDTDGDGVPDVISPPVKTGAAAALIALCIVGLSACAKSDSAIADPRTQSEIALACGAIQIADAAFQIAVKAGYVDSDTRDQEAIVMAAVAALCTPPYPQNTTDAVKRVLGFAAQIGGLTARVNAAASQ